MNCAEAKKRITLLAGGDLEPDERALLETHVSSCEKCRALLEACRADLELVGSLREAGSETPSFDEFWGRLKNRLEPETRKRRSRILFHRVLRGVTAAAVLLIAVTFLVNLGHEDPVRPPQMPTEKHEVVASPYEEAQTEQKHKGMELEECEVCSDTNRPYDF